MAEPNLQEIRDFLVELARKAGGLIMAATPSASDSDRKNNPVDILTETDMAVEKLIADSLREKYPDYRFLGEETYDPTVPLSADPTFVCDPIDGTTNFVHAFPNACISLAFVVGKRPLIGVVFNPFHNVFYTAIRGQGSYRNFTTRLPLSPHPAPLTGLGNALLALEWGHERSGPNYDVKRHTFLKLVSSKELGGASAQGVRMLGSAALNLCQLAAGELDIYWEGGPWAWDFAAGAIILEEAGGLYVDANPGNWEMALDGRKILAVRGAPSGQKELIEEFWSYVVGTYSYDK